MMNRRACQQELSLFIFALELKVGSWRNLAIDRNEWWRAEWVKIKQEFQVKIAQLGNSKIETLRVRERLELGVKGWQQALQKLYPMAEQERTRFRSYFLNSNRSHANAEALQEAIVLLHSLENSILENGNRVRSAQRKFKIKQKMKKSAIKSQISQARYLKFMETKPILVAKSSNTPRIEDKKDNTERQNEGSNILDLSISQKSEQEGLKDFQQIQEKGKCSGGMESRRREVTEQNAQWFDYNDF